MSLYDITSKITAGGVLSVIVIILSLIEITPIKLSPLQWIGDRINKNVESRVDDLAVKIDKVDGKLNNHIVESYRTQILDFADKVMTGQVYDTGKWRQMLKICGYYEQMIEQEHLINGDATEAIAYIRKEYQRCAENGRFAGFPQS